jgi:YbbR domain-containing protein
MLANLAQNWFLKLLSLVFALILWFFVMGERKLEVGYAIPLELRNLPAGLMVANEVPSVVDVRISGPRTLLMNLRPSDISIAVDLKELQPGLTSFKRLEERINIPSALKVTRISPSFIDVKLDRMGEKLVPVTVALTGTPAAGAKVEAVTVEPREVVVTGAEGELKDVSEVATEPVSVEGVKESFSLVAPINYRGRFTSLKETKTADVRVTITAPPALEEESLSGSQNP